jgi:RNA polymerase sigma factor (sigma-70 family)
MNQLTERQLDKIWHLSIFNNTRKEKLIMAEMPDYEDYLAKKEKILNKKVTENHYKFMCCEPILTRDQEYHLFRQYNFLKYKYKKNHKPDNLSRIKEIRDVIVCANVRLVMSVLHKQKYKDFEASLSDGCYGLIDAVDLFDFRKEFKFSTYAYWAVQTKIRYFSKVELKEDLHTVNNEEFLNDTPNKEECEQGAYELKTLVYEKLKAIPERERRVITHFFGLDGNGRLGLKEIGEKLKISKERVRQIKEVGLKRIQAMELRHEKKLSSYVA